VLRYRIGLAWMAVFIASTAVSITLWAGDRKPNRSRVCMSMCEVLVNDRRVAACIDTGASDTVIDKQILLEVGAHAEGTRRVLSPIGMTNLEIFSGVEIALGQFPPATVKPTAVVTSATFADIYPKVDLFLGLDYLRKGVVLLSADRISFATKTPDDFGVLESVSFSQTPTLRMCFEGTNVVDDEKAEQFHIDTGATSECRIIASLQQDLETRGLCVRGMRSESRTVSGVRHDQAYILREVNVGGVRFRNVPVSVGTSNAIGLGLLRHLNLAIDFPNQRLLVGKPPQEKIDRFPLNATGMLASFNQNEQLMVRTLRPDSPATKAGIEVGDEVLMIEGKSVEQLSFDDVTELFAQDGKTIQIQLRRGMQVRTVELALKLPFEYPPNWEAMDAKVEGFEKFLEEQEKAESSGSK
jgi:predicted aspartyl protease